MPVEAVVFDVGETLVDETRHWRVVADSVGMPQLTFLGVMGGLIERDQPHFDVYRILGVERVPGPAFEASDLYADAVPCLVQLRAAGYTVGVAANQPERTEEFLNGLGLELDLVAASDRWGVHKPAPEFFARVAAEVGLEPARIAYVGDRLDNDVLPALEAGMVAVHVRRGPWGYLHARRPEIERAHIRVDSLAELPAALAHA
jgi:HAD superfamily hydrolase (TIGR01509 family)